jgi:hypothetical protein
VYFADRLCHKFGEEYERQCLKIAEKERRHKEEAEKFFVDAEACVFAKSFSLYRSEEEGRNEERDESKKDGNVTTDSSGKETKEKAEKILKLFQQLHKHSAHVYWNFQEDSSKSVLCRRSASLACSSYSPPS